MEPKYLLVACVRCEKHWGDPDFRPGRVELPLAAEQGSASLWGSRAQFEEPVTQPAEPEAGLRQGPHCDGQ